MTDLSGAWLIMGALVPALLGSYATYPSTRLNDFAFGSLLSFSTVVIVSLQLHVQWLQYDLALWGQFEIPVIQLLFLHLGTVVIVAWGFLLVANEVSKPSLRRALTVTDLLLAMAITGHAVLLHNYLPA